MPAPNPQIATGALSFLGYGLEAARGIPAATIDNYLYVTGNNITATPDMIRKNVMMGNRAAEGIIRPSKFKIHGTLTHPLFGNTGAEFAMAGMGLDTYLAPITGAYAALATANGLTTFTTSDPLTPGAWSTWGVGAAQQLRQLIPMRLVDPAAASNAWAVAGLSAANSTGATGAFAQPAQHKFSPIPTTSNQVYSLPTLTLQMNEGYQWAWQLAGSYVGKYNIKGGKEDAEVSETMICTEMPVRLPYGSFASFLPTTAQLGDVARPFTINDGFIVVPNDRAALGASTLSALPSLEDWEWDWDNGMLEKAFWDGGQVYKAFPGLLKHVVKYKYAISAGRPDAYEDSLVQLHQTPVPFIASMGINIGTLANPVWYAYGCFTPSTIMTKADVGRSVTDVLLMSVEADALRTQAGDDLGSVFVLNSSTAAYVGS